MQGDEVLMDTKLRYWFPAKTYGWGWGLPATWEAWAVFAGYFALLIVGILWLPPRLHPIGFVLFVTTLTSILVGVCWRTGEPPRWRWGK